MAVTILTQVERNIARGSERIIRRAVALHSTDVIAFGRFLPGGNGSYGGFYVLRDLRNEYVTHIAYLVDDQDGPAVEFTSGHYYQSYALAVSDLEER